MKQSVKRVVASAIARVGPHVWPGREARLWILMYHRILPADDPRARLEEPGMMVTPETLAHHLSWAGTCMEFTRLADWIDNVRAGREIPHRSCAVTFDDGWADNYEHAFPVLRAANVPATIFVVSHMAGTKRHFWPNRLAFVLAAAGERAQREPCFEWLRAISPVALSSAADPDARARIINACKALDDQTMHNRLDDIEAWLGVSSEQDAALMSWSELEELVDSGLVDVGSHTRNHYRLKPGLPAELIEAEICESKLMLESRLHRPITLFCYPNGDYSDEVAATVKRNYSAAVTTSRGINTPRTPLTSLSRIGVHESATSTRSAFMARLSTWM